MVQKKTIRTGRGKAARVEDLNHGRSPGECGVTDFTGRDTAAMDVKFPQDRHSAYLDQHISEFFT